MHRSITITTDLTHPGYKRLVASAERFEIPLQTVVVKEDSYQEVITSKHLIIRDALEAALHEGVNRFLFLDGWDTVFVSPIATEMLTTEYLGMGAEKQCYPYTEWEPFYTTQSLPFPYLNSGVIWGPISEYLHLCPYLWGHDQGEWTRVYLDKEPVTLALDHYGEFVVNLHSTEAEDLSRFPDGVRYNPSGTWPCILHANGKWPMPAWAGL